jgi:hypothetical protein
MVGDGKEIQAGRITRIAVIVRGSPVHPLALGAVIRIGAVRVQISKEDGIAFVYAIRIRSRRH